MGWRLVQQPNGMLARFSSVIDNFTHMDMTEEEAIEVCHDYGKNLQEAKNLLQNARASFDKWDETLESIKCVHGVEEAGILSRYCALPASEEKDKLFKDSAF